MLVQLQKLRDHREATNAHLACANKCLKLKRAGNLTQERGERREETNCLCLIIRVTGIHSLSPITAKCEVFILVQHNLTLILLL